MACLLAKIDKPTIDPRKPYIQIGGGDAFSGRHYDETYIERLVTLRRLPVNRTTAFLTPALRNINHVLTPGLKIEGRPREMYTAAFSLLEAVHLGVADAESLLEEAIRVLLTIRDERDALQTLLLASFRRADEMLPLSSEEIVKLIGDHLRRRNASRLPVLAVAAAYKAAEDQLAERAKPLRSHNAADEQTGARGDIEILRLVGDRVVTAYEMKDKPVMLADIDIAMHKLGAIDERIDNYIFITTAPIDEAVQAYAVGLYERLGGVEIAILDCIGFIRHFLHLFHRIRASFLNNYQELVLAEDDSAVSPSLKEAFLVLRHAAEALHVLQIEESHE